MIGLSSALIVKASLWCWCLLVLSLSRLCCIASQNELDSIYKDVQREIKRAGKHVDELEGDTEAEIATRWSMGRPQFGLTRSMFTTAAEFRLALLKEEKKQLVS